MEKKLPYLCGGVLLFLLSNFTPAGKEQTNPDLMADLLKAITGVNTIEVTYTMRTRTSACINCDSESSLYIPRKYVSLVNDFVQNMTNAEKHKEHCIRMSHFVENHIVEEKAERFVKSLLYIIENDSEIGDSQLLYISNDGIPVTKDELKKTTLFTLPSFLVGILYFILTDRRMKNKEGLTTLDFLGSQHGNGRILENNIDNKIAREISIVFKENTPSEETSNTANDIDDLKLLEKFKYDYDPILMKCIETNFGEPFEANLIRVIQQLRSDCWNQKSTEFENPKLREMVIEIVNTLFQLSKHLSNNYYFSDIISTTNTESPLRSPSYYDWHSRKTSYLYIAQTQQRLKQLYKELYPES